MTEIIAPIFEAYPTDRIERIARVHPLHIEKLQLQKGDVIIIEGQKLTIAQVKSLDMIDDQVIRVNKYIRKSAGVTIGDDVKIKDHSPTSVTQVVLSEVNNKEINLSEREKSLIKEYLLGGPISEGDYIPIPDLKKLSSGEIDPIASQNVDVPHVFRASHVGGENMGIITEDTNIEFDEK